MEIFVLIVLLLIAVALFVSACYFYRKSKDTGNWEVVKGTVCDSKLDEYVSDSGTSYKAIVRYSYIVNGKEYMSGRIFFGDIIREGFSFKSKGLLNIYPGGTTVEVYYNPLKPAESVLRKGVHPNVMLMFITSFLLLVFTCVFYYSDKIN